MDHAFARVRASAPLWIGALASVALFLFAVQLLGTATEAAAVPLRQFFAHHVSGDAQALGVSWLATYVLTNGSIVAALSVSLFGNGIVTDAQLFLMVAGSRLGAAAIVVLIGALDYLQKRRYSLGEATSLGLLAFLLTHSVYLPATVVGYLALPWLQHPLESVGTRTNVSSQFSPLESVTTAVVDAVGAELGFVLAIAVLFASLNLFDRVLKRVDTAWLRARFFRRFQRTWVALALGVLLTGITTSVAFSLGVIVPLYNRGYLKRREVVPYVLGANLGTLFDTVLIAVVLQSPVGVALVLALLLVSTLLTLGATVWFDPYFRTVEAAHRRLVEDLRYFVGFVVLLIAVPVALALLPR
ncbi:sodium:phosphate symporter [Halobellus sp. H-GB7]|mgnify:CR=1 FL=1|uniref:sodium:phosphate symporter n=1 Tax=Halobellus sp. H-GB7 TaxID=3069756 RepID=UPI0027AED0CE|nr:sodium:phosphate symporter [Halobellus sp. H-GB7]MDQ2054541.1 sodium:phosphate symporter [Halobellus sp. H-GB7]